jgi:hypothetical protein
VTGFKVLGDAIGEESAGILAPSRAVLQPFTHCIMTHMHHTALGCRKDDHVVHVRQKRQRFGVVDRRREQGHASAGCLSHAHLLTRHTSHVTHHMSHVTCNTPKQITTHLTSFRSPTCTVRTAKTAVTPPSLGRWAWNFSLLTCQVCTIVLLTQLLFVATLFTA